MEFRQKYIDRFWSKVDKQGPEDHWEWCGGTNHGYGLIWMGYEFGQLRAHHIAWVLANGPVPPGYILRNRCERRSCCNPRHWFLMSDEERAGEMRSIMTGRVNTAARVLTNKQALEVRLALARGESVSELAVVYGVSDDVIYRLRRGIGYRDVEGPISPDLPPYRVKGLANMAANTAARVEEIRRLYASGEFMMREIAEMFDISVSGVSRLVNRNRRP